MTCPPTDSRPSKSLKEWASLFSDIVGVLGFLLALVLAYLTLVEHQDKITPTLRLSGQVQDERTPFAETPEARVDHLPWLVFTLHHERGRSLPIQSVAVKISLRPIERVKTDSGHWRTTQSFGPEGIAEYSEDAVRYYCWLLDKDGVIVPPEGRTLPFSEGSTRYYGLPLEGPSEHRARFRGQTHFTTLEVWAQDDLVSQFDISQQMIHGLEEHYGVHDSPARSK